jgi:hypothetical protein
MPGYRRVNDSRLTFVIYVTRIVYAPHLRRAMSQITQQIGKKMWPGMRANKTRHRHSAGVRLNRDEENVFVTHGYGKLS